MDREVVYLKCDRNVEVQSPEVQLKDVARVFCRREELAERLEQLIVQTFEAGGESRCVISVLCLIRSMEEVCPDILVQNVGETEILIEWVKVKKYKSWKMWPKIVLVSMISFFGTAFAIMAYHNDVGINDVFTAIYRMVMNREPGSINTLKVAYSVGLTLGIILFFNHIGGRRITKDPTPIEVALRNYEEDVDKTLITTAAREGIEKE